MRRHLTVVALVGALGMTSQAQAQLANVLFQENFNSLTLGDSVNERRGPLSFAQRTVPASDSTTEALPNAFTHTGPAGWTVDNNFDNFGNVDLNNDLGTPVFDATVPPGDPPVQLFKLGLAGFVIGNVGLRNQSPSPNDGVDEWEGWSFANKDFWISVEDQNRSQFTLGSGIIAVVDSDEYDDLGTGRGGGYYNSGLTTAAIPVTGLSSIQLSFDSSWRPESYDDAHDLLGYAGNNQTAIIWAEFDTGVRDFLPDSLWDSDAGRQSSGPLDPIPTRSSSPNYKPDSTNEHVVHSNIPVPMGASSVKFTFGYINAANDWWWAIDNLAVSDGTNAPFWTEGFEGVTLGDSVNERRDINPSFSRLTAANDDPNSTPRANSFTHTTPTGWNIDNSGINPNALGNNNVGVFEWEGWSFANLDFWTFADGQGRAEFTKGDGVFAIADSDEFDDLGGAAGVTRPMTTVLETPEINIAGLGANTLYLQFDSSWRQEPQTASIIVDYGSETFVALSWDGSKGDATNETVLIPLNNPAGATVAKISFSYTGGNNWWWAIDNVVVGVGVIPEPTGFTLAACMGLSLIAAGRRRHERRE